MNKVAIIIALSLLASLAGCLIIKAGYEPSQTSSFEKRRQNNLKPDKGVNCQLTINQRFGDPEYRYFTKASQVWDKTQTYAWLELTDKNGVIIKYDTIVKGNNNIDTDLEYGWGGSGLRCYNGSIAKTYPEKNKGIFCGSWSDVRFLVDENSNSTVLGENHLGITEVILPKSLNCGGQTIPQVSGSLPNQG